jgi:hypothetical protein
MSSPNWNFAAVADTLESCISQAESDLRLEQAVYGLDAMDELRIQEQLAERLKSQYDVVREVHYPSTAGRKLSHRARCDLVLTPKGHPLAPIEPEKPASPTLFDPMPTLSPDYCKPSDALWLEMKCAYQFRDGGVRHGGYGAQWRQNVVADLRKMEAEPLIREAGLLLVVFNEFRAILDKDLELFEDVLARKEVLAGFRQVRTVPITDRIGHQICTIALWPTIQR